MTRIVLLFAFLATLSSALAIPFPSVAKLETATNFDQCAAFDGPYTELSPSTDFGIAEMTGSTASRTGLIDFSVTDALLGFYDNYIMGSLLTNDLRSFMTAFGFGDMPDLREAIILVREQTDVD